jgi:hypothetical protein
VDFLLSGGPTFPFPDFVSARPNSGLSIVSHGFLLARLIFVDVQAFPSTLALS